jgi:hypothetical protein
MAYITIYANALSDVTSGPGVKHTVSYEATRNGGNMHFSFKCVSVLSATESEMGPGKRLYFAVTVDAGGQAAYGEATIKSSTSTWSGSEGLSKTVYVELDLYVGAATSVVATTGTYRTDSTTGLGKPGTHERTNTIGVPAPVAPNITGMTQDKPVAAPGEGVTFTVTGVSGGSGTITTYQWQASNDNVNWWQFAQGTTTARTISANELGDGSYGRGYYIRCAVVNSLGQTATSPSGYFRVSTAPGAVTCAASSNMLGPGASFTLNWGAVAPGDGTIAGYRVYRRDNGGGWGLIYTSTNLAEAFTIPVLAGQYSEFCVQAVNSYGIETAAANVVRVNRARTPYLAALSASDVPSGTLTTAVTWNHFLWVSPDGTISSIELRYHVSNLDGSGETTTAWYTGAPLLSYTMTLGQLAGAAPNKRVRISARATDSFGQTTDYSYSNYVTILGGLARIKVGGIWKTGRIYVKVAGVWKEAINVYQKVAGVWRQGV